MTPWTAARHASLPFTTHWSLLTAIESVMPSNHLILCHPLLLPPSIFPRIRVFSFFLIFFIFLKFYFIFKLYNIVLVLPYIEMNLPQAYMCSPSRTLLPSPSPYHPSGSSQCTSPKHPALCIEPGLATRFIYNIIIF